MAKINGYTEEEAKKLIGFVSEGKSKGKTLTYLFETYGNAHGRAKGSVRNYYYALMKNSKGDKRIVELLDGSSLSVEKIKEFTEEETEQTIRSILAEKSKGISVRKAICNIAQGNDKMMLRLQNKYRNTLKKQPEKIRKIADEMGVEMEEIGSRYGFKKEILSNRTYEAAHFDENLRRRLENEINALYDRLAQALKVENERLRTENAALKAALDKDDKKQA
jgi:hypothetical protein